MIESAVRFITLSMLKTILGVEFELTSTPSVEQWCYLIGEEHDLTS